jgi:hypothetical protein
LVFKDAVLKDIFHQNKVFLSYPCQLHVMTSLMVILILLFIYEDALFENKVVNAVVKYVSGTAQPSRLAMTYPHNLSQGSFAVCKIPLFFFFFI